jgi:polyphosphate kinase
VLGRYLEHSRIFAFDNAGDPDVFIGSADMMHRNLDRRVEALVKIAQTDQIRQLHEIFDLGMSESVAVWELKANGGWSRETHNVVGEKLLDMQDVLMEKTLARKRLR